MRVSIHALTRSATNNKSNIKKQKICFNPRTHEECDLSLAYTRPKSEVFQSTHSRGVRLTSAMWSLPQICFNPRTHEECDSMVWGAYCVFCVSIHALTRSATFWCNTLSVEICFNPRTHEECDSLHLQHLFRRWVSIHALTRSATLSSLKYISKKGRFNPRTHEECDRKQPLFM